MDAHTENRLNALETVIAIEGANPRKIDRIWVCAGYDGFRIAFDHNMGRSAFSLTKKQFEELIEETVYLHEHITV